MGNQSRDFGARNNASFASRKVRRLQFLIYYRCPEDGRAWVDVWSSCVDGSRLWIEECTANKYEEIVHANGEL
jgi:hypothetical protein